MSYLPDNSGPPPFIDLPEASDFHRGLPADIKAKIWSEVVKRDAREKNIFRDFMGDEGSGRPICIKKDLAAGGADSVRFTTTTPIRGQGVIGEAQLKGRTDKLRFGSFDVKVDLIRHGISHTQLLKLLKFTGKTVDELSSELMSEWAARKQQDDCMIAFRNTALDVAINGSGVNVHRAGGKQFFGASADAVSADVLVTEEIEISKQKLITNGAKPMSVESDLSGADIPQYLFFGPDTLIKPLRSDGPYLEAMRYSLERGGSNPQFKGSYPVWDNNMFHIHNIVIDTAEGRQGSPLAPRAYLGAALASVASGNTKTLTGGGVAYGASDMELDFFANFTGFPWNFITDDELGVGMNIGGQTWTTIQSNRSNQEHYLTVYDLFTHNYAVFKYDRADFSASGHQIVGATAVKVANGQTGNTAASVNLPQGALIFQSTKAGAPLEFGLHLGANGLYYAVGSIENEPIYHYDDFATASNRAHLNGVGIQTIRGLRAYQDTIGRLPNFMLYAGIAEIPGVLTEIV
jgi:N4-gp56 family major capsid protein